MANESGENVRERQDPLCQLYRDKPDKAAFIDQAATAGGTDTDPFHGVVFPGNQEKEVQWPIGIHQAVGGYHDLPNPGDILCAALAACLDSTTRIIANRLGVSITSLEVRVAASADARGTLHVDRNVPVGFQSIKCDINLQMIEGTNAKLVEKLIAAAEKSCVVLQTLRSGVPVEMTLNID